MPMLGPGVRISIMQYAIAVDNAILDEVISSNDVLYTKLLEDNKRVGIPRLYLKCINLTVYKDITDG